MIIWLLGNTTVRSPYRLRDGLIALSTSTSQGNLRGQDQEQAFCKLLGDAGVVSLQGDATYSVGRKWRSALSKLGFLYPKLTGGQADLQKDLGLADMITENGWRLINSEIVAGWQECFLRSLAAYYIPSVLEQRHTCQVFSPLRHTLAVMLELERKTGGNKLNFIEMALVVQLTSSEDGVENITNSILDFRERREKSSRKRKFDQEALDSAAETYDLVSGTFKDYADTNLRYIKATGLVQNKGKGIAFVPEKRVFIEQLVQDDHIPADDLLYMKSLCSGATLPTDEKDGAMTVLDDLVSQLDMRGQPYDLTGKNIDTPADIAIIRHEIEGLLSELNELDYAEQQSSFIEEISGYMDLLITRKRSMELPDGNSIEVPQSEAPAYFEWSIWRAFLAIDSLVNPPWEARRFKIDQDFLPVGTAPGNGPDMIFEFEDMVLVVEVTLTTSSRQEAAEGEPVRRHVAKYAEDFTETGKQVFGLFLAINIDTNTANTFRLGEWYLKDDQKIDLHIVPMALSDFKEIMVASSHDVSLILPKFQELLRNCRMYINKDSPEWKVKISELSSDVAESLRI